MTLALAAIAANRFGLGARNQDIKNIAGDPRGWLKAQLKPEPQLPAALSVLPSTEDASTAFAKYLKELGVGPSGEGLPPMGKANPAAGMEASGGTGNKLSVEQTYVKVLGPGYAAAVGARITVAESSERPFFERLVRFWGNHFTVSAAKPSVIALAPVFERDAIRPHVCGKFADMLLASCRHPAMLLYLDNYISIGPNSYLAKNPSVLPEYIRKIMKGLNENLAREILELHTLGVRGGYTQTDVTSLAKIITGWGYFGPNQANGTPGKFRFLAPAHEPGTHDLLGKSYSQDGEAQGETALRDLAAHPATADHLATKLARHFIADEPPASAVAAIAKAFRESQGDLAATASAIVDLPEAWGSQPVKFKQPEDLLISTIRALGAPKLEGQKLIALLDRMGQRPYWASGPDGWPDTQSHWISADAIWKRLEWADALSKGLAAANINPIEVGERALGPQLTSQTRAAIALAESPAQGLAIFLSCPEFQRR